MNKIMKLDEYDDAIFYRAACSCTDLRCDMTLELALYDDDEISLNIYQDLKYAAYWRSDNWFMDKWYRITGAIRLLFTGCLKVENIFTLGSVEQIDDFLKTLRGGMLKLKPFQPR